MNTLQKIIGALGGAAIIAGGGLAVNDAMTPADTAISKVEQRFDNSNLKNKYKLEDSRFIIKGKDNKNDTKTEIGETGKAEFEPSLNIKKWGTEASLKIKPDISKVAKKDKKLQINGEAIEYLAGDVGYTLKDNPQASENGGYDMDFTIKSKSVITALNPKNKVYASGFAGYELVFENTIESQGLVFYPQKALNEEPQEPGVTCTATECKDATGRVVTSRPEKVVDSIVIYSNGKAGNYEPMGGYNYMAGKVGNIDRLECVDANGSRVWGKQEVAGGKWRGYCPSEWLAQAVYPIKI